MMSVNSPLANRVGYDRIHLNLVYFNLVQLVSAIMVAYRRGNGMHIDELLTYLDELLDTSRFRDYCPNGLQVEGRTEVNRLVTGVTASQAFIDAGLAAGADCLLVHHGYFWKGEDPCITGMKRVRLGHLLSADVNLVAYHLPLDGHAEFGNNAQLMRKLGITPDGELENAAGAGVLVRGRLDSPASADDLSNLITDRLGRKPLHISGGDKKIQSIALCTGAGQGFINQAAEAGLDAFITGEVSEPTVHIARESGIHFFAAGHHATERYGVAALGEHLAEQFGIEHQFIDIDNPA